MRDAYNQTTQAGEQGHNETLPVDGFKQVIDPAAKEAYLKALNEIKQRTDQINFDAEKSGMTQLEQLQRVYEMNQKILDQKAEEISLSKDFNDEQKKNLLAALNNEKDANTRKFNSNASQAPGQEYEAAIIAGKSMTSDITKAFQSGTMGMVTGLLGAVDAFVGVAQAVVDFIPGLLNKIANLFNSLTDLPNKIVSGMEGVLKGILNFISNFIPNIAKAVPKIAKMLVEFLKNGLPSAIKALVDAVPEMVMSLIDSIPDIVEAFVIGFVYSLIDMVPLVVIALINQLVPQLPRIAIALVKALTVGLVQAIANGVKSAFGGITKLFTGGKGPKIFDAKDISKELDKIKKLTGSSNDLFGVKDLANNAAEEARNQATQFGDAIKNGMDESIRKLIQAWRWVYDNIIAPIGGMLSNAWKGLTQAFDDIFSFFGDIGTMIVDGIKHGIPAIGQMFEDLFNSLDPSNLFKKMFNADGATGKGDVETALGIDVPFLKFAKGGHVPGQARVSGDNLLNDRILALLSPGEAVIPRSAMQDKRVREIVDSILNGNLKVPAFSFGDVVKSGLGKISDAASSATSGGTLGKVFGGDFSGAASDIANMNPKQAAEELAKARDKAIEIVEAMIPGSPWRLVWEKVQDMIMTMFKQNRFAMGGLVTGPSGVDTIPASLSAGEFVLNRSAVSSIGLGNLNRMNAGGQMSGNTVTQNIEITIDARGERIDESFVRQRLMPAIKAELKRSSLDGERTISSRGVR
jgi:ABC-type multidrug transport system fused ATPase/permease subunit